MYNVVFSNFCRVIDTSRCWHFGELVLQKAWLFLHKVISKIFSVLNFYAYLSRFFSYFQNYSKQVLSKLKFYRRCEKEMMGFPGSSAGNDVRRKCKDFLPGTNIFTSSPKTKSLKSISSHCHSLDGHKMAALGQEQATGPRGPRPKCFLLVTFMHWRRKWQPIPVFLPGESWGRRSLVGCRLWGRMASDTTEVIQQQQQKVQKEVILRSSMSSCVKR